MKKQKRTPLAGLDVSAKRLQLLSEAFPSVLDLSGANVSQLLALDPQMHISEARELLARAKTVAVVTARQFRERRLSSGVRTAYMPATGVKGLVQGPTYTDMFTPNWAEMCPPNAIEATTSPIAYLTDLYREVDKIEATAKGQSFPLATRRPDLAGLMLDHTALNQIVPTLTLSNEILETSISQFLNEHHNGMGVDDALLQTRYPMGLPYERYQQQITYVLGRKKQSPGDAIRCTDMAYPYFKEPGVHSQRSDDALQQDTGFGPEQQSLLLEAPYFAFGGAEQSDKQGADSNASLLINPRSRLIENRETRAADFFQRHYGVSDSGELLDTQTFCLRTGITTDELDSLLSVGPYAPTVSPNAGVTVASIDGATFGSVYINGGALPAIAIETLTDTATGADGRMVTVTLGHTLVNCTPDRFDRINRMLRLAKWLMLSFNEVDRLLCACKVAERRTDVTDWSITTNTLRALGLFQTLRRLYKVSAQEFATFIGGIGLWGLGKEPAQFDRIFNSQVLFSLPFRLDDQTFAISPSNEADRRKIDQMCAALGMSHETYRFCAALIQQAQGRELLSWNSFVVSAFYRLARLPRYLGISAIEALALLELLDEGASQLIATLAGVPHVATYQSSTRCDTVSALHALFDIHLWMEENQWSTSKLYQLLRPASSSLIATQTEYSLMQQMNERLAAALISDSSFAEIGASSHMGSAEQRLLGLAPHAPEPIDWFLELAPFIHGAIGVNSPKGLVKYMQGETDALFEEALRSRVQEVFDTRKESSTDLLPKLVNMIMRARGMQEALLMEGLGNYLTVSADLAKELLAWVGASREKVLIEVMRVALGMGSTNEPSLPINDEVLKILEGLSKRAAIIQHLSLSPALVAVFVLQPQWFALPDNALSLPCVYTLSQYARILSFSEQNEEQLLDYFRLINSRWPNEAIAPDDPDPEAKTREQEAKRVLIRAGAARKLAISLRWGIREVLQAAAHANDRFGVVFNVRELDLLLRMRLFEQAIGVDTQALLALGNLSPTSDLQTYRHAAELALTSLNETLVGRPIEEVGQSLTSVITVSQETLVANDPTSPVALIALTLHDLMDQPVAFAEIQWSTNLSDLRPLISTTDEHGRATTYLKSGNTMGVAQVIATFGIDEMVMAPRVTIDCDKSSLRVIDAFSVPTSVHSNGLDVIDFGVTLVDQFGNLGRDCNVEWGTDLGEFQRFTTRTDPSGIARASLRSRDHGLAHAVAQLDNETSHSFSVVQFISTPYVHSLSSNSLLVVGSEVVLMCRVVEMNGQPLKGQAVNFKSDMPTLKATSATTNADGMCQVRYVPENVGDVTVIVDFERDGKKVLDSMKFKVYEMPSVIQQKVSSAEYIEGDTLPIEFTLWLKWGESIAPPMDIQWAVNIDDEISVAKTDREGVVRFITKNFSLGTNTVIAKTLGGLEITRFTIECVEKVVYRAVLIAPDDKYARPDFLSGNTPYVLNVKVFNTKGEVVTGRKLRLVNCGADLSILGVLLPEINSEVVSSLHGHDFAVQGTMGRVGILSLGVQEGDSAVIHRLNDLTLGWLFYVSSLTVHKSFIKIYYTLYSGFGLAVLDNPPILTIGTYVVVAPIEISSSPGEGDAEAGGIAYSVSLKLGTGDVPFPIPVGKELTLHEVVAEKGHVIMAPFSCRVSVIEPDPAQLN